MSRKLRDEWLEFIHEMDAGAVKLAAAGRELAVLAADMTRRHHAELCQAIFHARVALTAPVPQPTQEFGYCDRLTDILHLPQHGCANWQPQSRAAVPAVEDAPREDYGLICVPCKQGRHADCTGDHYNDVDDVPCECKHGEDASCTCPTQAWTGDEMSDSTCKLPEEEHLAKPKYSVGGEYHDKTT
jgi:hypothetical protein